MAARATRNVLRSVVAPALRVPMATLAAAVALAACERSNAGPYTGPVGMVPMAHEDAGAGPVEVGMVPAAREDAGADTKVGMVPAAGDGAGPVVPVGPTVGTTATAPTPVPGMPPRTLPFPGPLPNPPAPGFAPSAAGGVVVAARPLRSARRATDADEGSRYAAFRAPRLLG